MKPVVVFGLQDFAELAHYYLTHDSPYEVVAFCVHEAYMPDTPIFKGLPVVPFEQVPQYYPPESYSFFAPMAPKQINSLRKGVYETAKALGYHFISYISSRATVFDNIIGENCFILEDNTLQPFTQIGHNVILWSGNHIGHHGIIHDHVMFTSHVVLSGHCEVGPQSFLGVNATIRDGLVLSEGSLIAMAASVTQDTEAWGVYVGNPAKRLEGKHSKDVRL